MHISEMNISQIYIFSGLFLNYMYLNLVLVCNEDAQYMRLQRIQHFPFHARLIESIKITNYEFQTQTYSILVANEDDYKVL